MPPYGFGTAITRSATRRQRRQQPSWSDWAQSQRRRPSVRRARRRSRALERIREAGRAQEQDALAAFDQSAQELEGYKPPESPSFISRLTEGGIVGLIDEDASADARSFIYGSEDPSALQVAAMRAPGAVGTLARLGRPAGGTVGRVLGRSERRKRKLARMDRRRERYGSALPEDVLKARLSKLGGKRAALGAAGIGGVGLAAGHAIEQDVSPQSVADWARGIIAPREPVERAREEGMPGDGENPPIRTQPFRPGVNYRPEGAAGILFDLEHWFADPAKIQPAPEPSWPRPVSEPPAGPRERRRIRAGDPGQGSRPTTRPARDPERADPAGPPPPERERPRGERRERVPRADFLAIGDTGEMVAAAQTVLGVEADGIYGPETAAAVRQFQAENGLVVDGILGSQTAAALLDRDPRDPGELLHPQRRALIRA